MAGSSSSAGGGGSWSSASSSWRQHRGEEDFSSPIRYREGPLEYEPAVLCHCKRKVARWISWSNGNPGRRYYKCYNARSGGCGFWLWMDNANSIEPFLKQLLIDLRNAVRDLKRENKDLASVVSETTSKMDEQVAEIAGLRKLVVQEVAGLRKLVVQEDGEIADLRNDVKKLEKERVFLCLVLVVLIAVVVAGMISN